MLPLLGELSPKVTEGARRAVGFSPLRLAAARRSTSPKRGGSGAYPRSAVSKALAMLSVWSAVITRGGEMRTV